MRCRQAQQNKRKKTLSGRPKHLWCPSLSCRIICIFAAIKKRHIKCSSAACRWMNSHQHSEAEKNMIVEFTGDLLAVCLGFFLHILKIPCVNLIALKFTMTWNLVFRVRWVRVFSVFMAHTCIILRFLMFQFKCHKYRHEIK